MGGPDRSPGLGWDAEEDGLCALPYDLDRPPRWRLEDDGEAVVLRLDRTGTTERLHPRVVPILEAIAASRTLPELVRRARANGDERAHRSVARSARHLVALLADQENLHVQLPPVPARFADRFERVRELGRGGVGVAWLCTDLERDRPVVVKHAWNWTGPLARRDQVLRDEAEVMALLDHPAVVALVDTFEIDGRFHLVRDYVEGRELARTVLWDGPPDADERRAVTRGFATALDHLHERDVLLLDPAPSNLMLVDGAPGVVLSDVGHCRVAVGGRIEGVRAWGTRHYAAPELKATGVATAASDVYGLGAVHCFLVTRRAPRGHGSLADALAAMRGAGAADDELALVEACCREDPGERPARPGAAADLLR